MGVVVSDQHRCRIFGRSLIYILARQTPLWASAAFTSAPGTRSPVMRVHPSLSMFFARLPPQRVRSDVSSWHPGSPYNHTEF